MGAAPPLLLSRFEPPPPLVRLCVCDQICCAPGGTSTYTTAAGRTPHKIQHADKAINRVSHTSAPLFSPPPHARQEYRAGAEPGPTHSPHVAPTGIAQPVASRTIQSPDIVVAGTPCQAGWHYLAQMDDC